VSPYPRSEPDRATWSFSHQTNLTFGPRSGRLAAIAAERIVHHLARSRFIVMKKLSLGGHSAFQGVRNGPFLPRHGSLGPLGSRLENYQVTPSTRR